MAADTPVTSITNTRLHGRWLGVVRTAWVVVFITVAVMYALGFLAVQEVLSTVCLAEPCTLRQHMSGAEVQLWPGPPYGYAAPLRPDQLGALEALGLTLDQYAWLGSLQIGLPTLMFLLIAAGLFWQKSDDWMVLFVSGVVATIPVGNTPLSFTLAAYQPAWAWVENAMTAVALSGFLMFPLFFPTGRFVPGWTRWMVVYEVVGAVSLIFLGNAVAEGSGVENFVLIGFLIPSFAVGVYAQIHRYFRVASPTERQQLKWVIVGLASFVGSVLLVLSPLEAFLASPSVSANPVWALALSTIPDTIFLITLLFIPISITLSVLRYRLWDIDFAINRALVYGALTALLGGVFVVAFFGLRALWEAILGPGQEVVAAVLPAVFVALIFNPTRRWLRNFVDRRFYGIQIEYTPAKVSPATDSVHTQFGPYRQLEFVGRGGMAEVYRTNDPKLKRPVAIKVLSRALIADSDFRKRFEREAHIASMLKHPNIVQVFEFGEADDTPYMVMEFIGGQDLSDYLRRHGRLPLNQALPILRPIASALDYAHQKGLVHRDIKPSNVMLDGARPVLTDFGIAKLTSAHTRFTQTGGVLGTFDYIAPEQIQGAAHVDGRADIYALGVMAYQILTGEMPFKHQNPGALLIAHLTQPPPNPRDIVPNLPRHVVHVIHRALAKKPDERFTTAGEFVEEMGKTEI